MAVFMDNGGGDIYAGETKEECIKAMYEDSDEYDYAYTAFEVPGTAKVIVESEDAPGTEEMSTLEAEYVNQGHGYCLASDNC